MYDTAAGDNDPYFTYDATNVKHHNIQKNTGNLGPTYFTLETPSRKTSATATVHEMMYEETAPRQLYHTSEENVGV